MARHQTPSKPGFEDAAPRREVLFDYDIPEPPDDDGLLSESTPSFGVIKRITMKLLTPLIEKHAAKTSGDPVQLAYELAKRSIAEVTNTEGRTFKITAVGGVDDELWGQMHPKLRSMAMQAYADNASPAEETSKGFLASRRTRT